MKTKHTPGPWRLESDTRNGGTERIVTTEDGASSISWTPPVAYGVRSDDELDANARLIAAAPELLEALQDFLDAFDLDDLANFTGEQCNAILSARAAIAKAEGES